jgi:hypothetical protein
MDVWFPLALNRNFAVMSKSPRPPKLSGFKSSKNSRSKFAKKAALRSPKNKKSAFASRRQFLRGAGLAAAAVMIPRPVKAAFNVKQSWQKAIALLAPGQDEPSIVSLDSSGFEGQEATNWCWAATTYNLNWYYDDDCGVSQCGVVNQTLSEICGACDPEPCPDCCEDHVDCDPYCNTYGALSVASDSSCYGGPMDFSDIADYIYNTGPVMAYIGACATSDSGADEGGGSNCSWADACEYSPCTTIGFAHYLTIVGYTMDYDDDEVGAYLLTFDPWSSDGLSEVENDNFPENNSWPSGAPANEGDSGDNGDVNWWDTLY